MKNGTIFCCECDTPIPRDYPQGSCGECGASVGPILECYALREEVAELCEEVNKYRLLAPTGKIREALGASIMRISELRKRNEYLEAENRASMGIQYALYHNKIRDGSGRCGEPCGLCRIEELERELEELKRKM